MDRTHPNKLVAPKLAFQHRRSSSRPSFRLCSSGCVPRRTGARIVSFLASAQRSALSASLLVTGVLGVGVEGEGSPSIPIPRFSLCILDATAVGFGTAKTSMIGVIGGASDPCGHRVREGEGEAAVQESGSVGGRRGGGRRLSQVDAPLLAVWAELAAAYPVPVFDREQGVERRAKALLLLLILEEIPHHRRWALPSVTIVASRDEVRRAWVTVERGGRGRGVGVGGWALS